MATPTSPIFKQIDGALAQYYQDLNVANYSDCNKVGLFVNYIKKEELDDPQLPIEEELGDKCDPYNCTYTEIWKNNGNNFPIPPYAQIPHNTIEAFIFYILQCCYKYGQPPSNYYIQAVLVPQCNGTINSSLLIDNAGQALCPFNAHLTPRVYQIKIFVNFYLRGLRGDYINIINCIQRYLLGEEGTMCCIVSDDDSVIDDDDAIADIDNGKRLTAQSNYAITYYTTVSKNRRHFCLQMKRYYKASYGKTIKIFEEFEKVFANMYN